MTYPATFARRLLDMLQEVVRHLLAPDAGQNPARRQAGIWFQNRVTRLIFFVTKLTHGLLPPPAKPRPSRPRTRPTPSPRALRLPLHRKGWLRDPTLWPEMDAESLRTVLAGPELEPLLAVEPIRLARLLRPLCHALGIAMPAAAPAEAPEPTLSTPPKAAPTSAPWPAPAPTPAAPQKPLTPPVLKAA